MDKDFCGVDNSTDSVLGRFSILLRYPDFRCFFGKPTIFAPLTPGDPLFYRGLLPKVAVVETRPIDTLLGPAVSCALKYVFASEQTI